MKLFQLGEYLLKYSSDIKTETYSNKDFYGIIFYIEGKKYDLVQNHLMGSRIFVSSTKREGVGHDIPFKPDTFHLLPKEVKVSIIESKGE